MYYMTWSKRNNAATTQTRRDAWTQAQDTQPRAAHDHARTRLHADHKADTKNDLWPMETARGVVVSWNMENP